MNNLNKSYNSKLLLFGEFVTIKGAQALAIPLNLYHGQWAYTTQNIPFPLNDMLAYMERLAQQQALFCDYDLSSFKKNIQQGLYFPSDIPIGYGLGSSAALCAAIYDSFCTQKITSTQSKDLVDLKKNLAQLENFFHGESSGTDPLICYLNQAVLISSKTAIEIVECPSSSPSGKGAIFLLNTHMPRKTGPLVQTFLEYCKNDNYHQRCQAELIPYNDEAIVAFLQGQWTLLLELVHHISHFQYKYFQPMIPNTFQSIWLQGLASSNFKLKICGAGGGGFILGICTDFEKTKKELKDYDLQKVLAF